MLFQEAMSFAEKLDTLSDKLRYHGFAPGRGIATELARAFANSTLPLDLFREWLVRSPEAQAAFFDMLDDLHNDRTGPIAGTGANVKTPAESPADVGEWKLTVDMKAEPLVEVPIRHEDFAAACSAAHEAVIAAGVKLAATYTGNRPAQKSEPVELPKAEPADTSASGVRGATASSLVVSLGDAAKLLGKDAFHTRPVTPKDTEPRSLGVTEGFRGQAAVIDAEGKPVRAVVKFNNGERVVEFLDKRGPLILARLVGGEDAGTVVTICIEFVEPRDRERVLSYLDTLPGSKETFNFSPFDGSSDPWDKSQTISHPTTVEEPTFGG